MNSADPWKQITGIIERLAVLETALREFRQDFYSVKNDSRATAKGAQDAVNEAQALAREVKALRNQLTALKAQHDQGMIALDETIQTVKEISKPVGNADKLGPIKKVLIKFIASPYLPLGIGAFVTFQLFVIEEEYRFLLIKAIIAALGGSK